MGAAIIQALETGFSLIGELATTFLTGFTTLFWDASANSNAGALTVFGTFALVMLSVAIVFSIIKLCLNLVRSNTGV